MIIPVHIDAKLIDFSEICQKKTSDIGCFLLIVSLRSPWNRPIFLWICPWKSFEIWLFSAKMPRNRPIFLWILTFLPRNRPNFFTNLPLKILRNFSFFSVKYQKPCWECQDFSYGSDNIRRSPKTARRYSEEFDLIWTQEHEESHNLFFSDFPY